MTNESAVSAPISAEQMRNQLRAKIFDSEQSKTQSLTIQFFGADIELRQPSIGAFLGSVTTLESGENDDTESARQHRLIKTLLTNAYVPGTDERVFTDGDYDIVAALPFGPDMSRAIDTINTLTGVKVKEATKN